MPFTKGGGEEVIAMRKAAGAKGGKIASGQMTQEERHARAKKAAQGRWGVLQANYEGPLTLHGITIPSAVLSDGTRVLTQAEFLLALGRQPRGDLPGTCEDNLGSDIVLHKLPVVLAAQNLEPFISKEIRARSNPIEYQDKKGKMAWGYDATFLADVCDVYLDADDAGALRANQQHIVTRCRQLMRGFAKIGIIAVVDEATGYQRARSVAELREKLNAYLSEEQRDYAPLIPDKFYEHLFRVRGWNWIRENPAKGPRILAGYTVDLIYARLEEGLLPALYERTPRVKGELTANLSQHLSDEGHKKAAEYLVTLISKMEDLPTPRAQSEVRYIWRSFLRTLDRNHPRKTPGAQGGFGFEDPDHHDAED